MSNSSALCSILVSRQVTTGRHIKILEDRRKLKRPDIVVIPRLKEAAVIPETFQFRRGKESMQ
eukprot:5240469-Pyramimonas_sp.AAC.1